ncbi:putative porin [Pseudoalteromonas spongiae]|uniref:putative porin n=1 Tax=Pseudoalteromonas spongiae TaxID=298657 RepID=UPI00110BD8A8|nr:putative porin [Pseudoalteromonas spongiae]TMO87743.1 hypothetical protein CWC15_02710 [Pseudoalteromonas spongiae]
MKKFLLSGLLMAATGVNAASYQSFNEFNYVNADNYDGFAFSSHYFFKPQAMIGVLDEFGYLNTDTNLYGSIHNFYDDNAYNIGGEYFLSNNVFITAGVAKQGDYDAFSAGAGYLINDDFKVSARYSDADGQDGEVFARAEYNHQINRIDYLAFSFDTEVDLDSWELASRYFMALNSAQHLAVDASVTETGNDIVTRVFGTYYLNQAISAGVGVNDGKFEVKAKYYTDANFAFSIGYQDIDEALVFAVYGQF